MKSLIAIAALLALLSGCAKDTTLVLDCVMNKDIYKSKVLNKVGVRQIFKVSLEGFSGTESNGCYQSNTVTDQMIVTAFNCDEPDSASVCRDAFERTVALNRITGELELAEQCRLTDGNLGTPLIKMYRCEKAEQKF